MHKSTYQIVLLAYCGVNLTMDYAPDGTNPLQMTLIGLFRLVQHHHHLLARRLGKEDQVRFSSINFF